MIRSNFRKNSNTLFELTKRNVKTQYRSSFLGMVWSVLNPLLNMIVMYIVFSSFFGRGDKTYSIYLLSGNILMSSLSSSTNSGLGSIVGNRGLLSKIKMEPFLFPLSHVFSAFVNFLFSLIPLFCIMIYVQFANSIQLFSLSIFAILAMFPAFLFFEFGLALFLSSIFVYCRDIKYLYSVFLTLWMYITPIFYKFGMADESLNTIKQGTFASKIIKLNPMYYFVRFFRESLYMGYQYEPVQDCLFLYVLGIGSVVIGMITYKLLKKNFMRNI